MATVTQCDLCKSIVTKQCRRLGIVDTGNYFLSPSVIEMCDRCSDYVISQYKKALDAAPTAGLIKKAAGG